MSNESATTARQRFARDLRRIREQQDVSIEALHEATQAPEPHIRAFENGTLDEQSRMNAVYLKAFVRAYAETLEIPVEPVIEQLEAALTGDYQNQLAVQFLDEPPSGTWDEQSETDGPESPREQESTPEQTRDVKENRGSDSSGGTREETSTPPEPKAPTDARGGDMEGRPERTEAPGSTTPPSRSGDSLPSGGDESSLLGSIDFNAERLWGRYGRRAFVVVALLVLGLGAGVASLYFGEEGVESSSEPAVTAERASPSASPNVSVPPDTGGAEPDTSSQSQRPPASVVLGDTLHVVLEATSVVAGVRVQQDDDLRRPYWIEEGEAEVFPFTRRIAIEDQLDSLRLFLENYAYPTTRTNEDGRIIISRDTAEQFVDTLRGTPGGVPTPSDTVQIDSAPEPDSDSLAQDP